MRSWAQYINRSQINQWNIGSRSLLLLILLFVLWGAWYFLLEKPLLENNQAILTKQAHDQSLVKELSAIIGLRANFVYKNELKTGQLKQVFQDALSGASGLTMTSYVDNPAVALPAGAGQFAQVATVLKVSLSNTIQQSSATMVFSGGFNNFVVYLQALQSSSGGIYFDSIEFNMNRYPKAEITMKVFTLEGA